jgi:hypothetical protein
MPKLVSKKSSTVRRQIKADDIKSSGWVTMRPCTCCLSEKVSCVMSASSDSCERCYRFNRYCDLSPPSAEIAKLSREDEKLGEQIFEAEAKSVRLRKQRRLIRKKLRDLGDREAQNISELEKDEAQEGVDANTVATSEPPGANSSSTSGDPALSPSYWQNLSPPAWGSFDETVESNAGTS